MSSISTAVEGHAHEAAHGHHDPNLQHHFATKEQQFDTTKIGMWLFLATEILMFGGLFAGFAYMQSRFPEAFFEAHKHLQVPLGTLNTIVLLISASQWLWRSTKPLQTSRSS